MTQSLVLVEQEKIIGFHPSFLEGVNGINGP